MAEDQLDKEYDREIEFNTVYTDGISTIISVTNHKWKHDYIEASFGSIHIISHCDSVPDISVFNIKDADVKRIVKAVLAAGYSGFQEAHIVYNDTFLSKCVLLECKMLPITIEVNMDTIGIFRMNLNCIAKRQRAFKLGGFNNDNYTV